MSVLIIINDGPYGTEKAYNALRLAMTLKKQNPEMKVRIFLLADSVSSGFPDQKTPSGYYNVEGILANHNFGGFEQFLFFKKGNTQEALIDVIKEELQKNKDEP